MMPMMCEWCAGKKEMFNGEGHFTADEEEALPSYTKLNVTTYLFVISSYYLLF